MNTAIEKQNSSYEPGFLYHYTTQEGMLGIIKNKSIWATNIYYLNDSTEYEYAVGLFEKLIKKDFKSQSLLKRELSDLSVLDKIKLKFIEHILDSIIKLKERFFVYVCSFSAVADDLSQWRGYSPRGNGFLLKFKTSYLKERLKEYEFLLVKCIYEKEDQNKLLKGLITLELDRLKNHGESKNTTEYYKNDQNLASYNECFRNAIMGFFIAAPQLKDKSFEKEEEWRFVMVTGDPKDKEIKFRQGTSMVIPYKDVNISKEKDSLQIDEIMVGPTPHLELSKKAVETLLKVNDIRNCRVELSNVPYRSW